MSITGVSVIIPCYNGESYVRQAIESVLGQKYRCPIEVFVCDDGSTDGSAAIAASFGSPVRVLQQPDGVNRGLPSARNLGIKAATQPLIFFLDCDDLWAPGHLEALVSAFEANPKAGLYYDNGQYMDNKGNVFMYRHPAGHQAIQCHELLLDNCLAVNGVAVPKAVFSEVGLFDESLRYAEDHDMWLRILERYFAVYVPVVGYYYRIHDAQMTHNKDVLWRYAMKVLERASRRFPYERSTIRKRHAVIAYHFALCALGRRQPLRALWMFGKSAVNDPARSIREGMSILHKAWPFGNAARPGMPPRSESV